MTYLSQLPPDLQDLLVRLPFRVGYFISESDQTGGDESAEAERQAIENIVTFYVEDTVKGEFAHEVMNQTLARKAEWAEWTAHIGRVDEECHKMTDSLVGVIDMKEVIAFQNNLLEIAIVVAQAYREFDAKAGMTQKFQVYWALFIRRLIAAFRGDAMQSNEDLLNISPAERSAIKLLADVMKVKINF